MALRPSKSQARSDEESLAARAHIIGEAKVDRRTKDLVQRLKPGDIAVISHTDLDVVAAETLVEARPAAVINADASSSGRYPNQGPLLVIGAGIPLVDRCGPDVIEEIADGDQVQVVGAEVYRGDVLIARGVEETVETIAVSHQLAMDGLDAEFGRFVANTLTYIEQDRDLLGSDLEFPDVGLDFDGRHVLIVVRGSTYREDLQILSDNGYLADLRPILIGVDGGSDALMELGHTPDLIVGDFDAVTERTLRSGAQRVVHAYKDGHAPGAARLDELGLEYHTMSASGTSEDIAMLLAYEQGAELIVAVGTHTSMVEFLDKGRAGMASTVLVRMKIGTRLVDAKGVSKLYHTEVHTRDLILMVLAAAFALGAVVMISAPIRLIIKTAWLNLTNMALLSAVPAPGRLLSLVALWSFS